MGEESGGGRRGPDGRDGLEACAVAGARHKELPFDVGDDPREKPGYVPFCPDLSATAEHRAQG